MRGFSDLSWGARATVLLGGLLWGAIYGSGAAMASDVAPFTCQHNNCSGNNSDIVPGALYAQLKLAQNRKASRAAGCPKGYKDAGTICIRPARSYKAPSRVANCPKGWTNMGAHCGKGLKTKSMGSMKCQKGYFKKGARCYKKCRRGYSNRGETCNRAARTISKKSSGKPGKKPTGNVGRVADCPRGYTNNGATCGRGAKSYKASSRVANCPKGWTNMGAHCGKGLRTKSLSSMVCKKGYFKKGARCYKACKSGYRNTGETCYRAPSTKGMASMGCRRGEVKKGARCYQASAK